MADTAAGGQLTNPRARRGSVLFWASRAGRVGRWLACGVVLAVAPVLISVMFLPNHSSVGALLGHGDLAVLAAALAAASLSELLGPDEPTPWLRNILALSCV